MLGIQRPVRRRRSADHVERYDKRMASWVVRTGVIALLLGVAYVHAPAADPLAEHVASGTPGVALLGGGHFGCVAPWSKNVSFTWLSKPLPCFHCEWLCSRAENECLTTIRPAAIADALLAQYDASRNSIPAATAATKPRPGIVPARH